jgi:phosphoribosylaminoimidazole-succinocarboxamide synthase
MPSVKEVLVDEEPGEGLGLGRFRFTDAYSVFDWGEMPDTVPNKGAALCTMGAFNFTLLEINEVPTHYRGVVGDDGEVRSLVEVETPPTEMAVAVARRPALPHDEAGYDYAAYHAAAGDGYVVPLEVIFRNAVPPASSLRERYTPKEAGLDRETWPEGVVDLPAPIVEFSTKFESQDRYLDREEAAKIAGVADIDLIERLATAVNHVLTDRAEQRDLRHLDGKIEVVYDDGAIRVADVAGTFDENRYTYRNQPISKEVLRQYHREHQSAWVEAVKTAKAEARAAGETDWRARCERSPEPLPEDVVQAASDLYTAGVDAYTDDEWFGGPTLDEAVAAVEDL